MLSNIFIETRVIKVRLQPRYWLDSTIPVRRYMQSDVLLKLTQLFSTKYVVATKFTHCIQESNRSLEKSAHYGTMISEYVGELPQIT